MDDRHVIEITAWLMQSGLKGMSEADLLAGFCERCRANGMPIERSVAVDGYAPSDLRGACVPLGRVGSTSSAFRTMASPARAISRKTGFAPLSTIWKSRTRTRCGGAFIVAIPPISIFWTS